MITEEEVRAASEAYAKFVETHATCTHLQAMRAALEVAWKHKIDRLIGTHDINAVHKFQDSRGHSL